MRARSSYYEYWTRGTQRREHPEFNRQRFRKRYFGPQSSRTFFNFYLLLFYQHRWKWISTNGSLCIFCCYMCLQMRSAFNQLVQIGDQTLNWKFLWCTRCSIFLLYLNQFVLKREFSFIPFLLLYFSAILVDLVVLNLEQPKLLPNCINLCSFCSMWTN